MKNENRGFTLIELLVVVLIVGILAAVAVPQYTKAVERSRLAEVWSNLGTIRQISAINILQKGEAARDLSEWDISFSCIEGAGSGSDCYVTCPSGRWYEDLGSGLSGSCRYYTAGSAENPVAVFEGRFSIPGGTRTYITLTLDNNGRSCSDGNSGATCKYLGIE